MKTPRGIRLNNLTLNYGLCQGTTGAKTVNSGITPTGNVAAGCQIFASIVSSTASLAGDKENPRTDGLATTGERQYLDFNSTSSGGNAESVVFNATSIQQPTTGQVVVGEATYELVGTPTPFNITGISLELVDAGASGTSGYDGANVGGASVSFNIAHKGILRTPPITVTSASPNFAMYCRTYHNTTFGATGARSKVYWGDMRFYTVPV